VDHERIVGYYQGAGEPLPSCAIARAK
jgi:hypothetical protein